MSGFNNICKLSLIHHFHIDHNAPWLDFSRDDCYTQEKLEKMVVQNFGRGGGGGKQSGCNKLAHPQGLGPASIFKKNGVCHAG